jgi:glycosyltransferase involved in cell wall biosynthesis
LPPLVSILIPCRDAAPWLAACLDSALAQRWVRCEVIVVDDGSTDNSREIAAGYADRGVRLIEQPATGASAARNRALEAATGDFLQFLDADDLLHPDKIGRQLEVLERSQPGCLGVSAVVHFPDGADPKDSLLDEGWPMRNAEDPTEWLVDLHGGNGQGGMIATPQWIVPRSVAEAAGPWDDTLTLDDDGEYFARVVLASTGLRFARTSIAYIRKHAPGGNNLSALGHRSRRHMESALQSLRLRATYLLEARDEPRTRRALAGCFSNLAVAAYPTHGPVYRAARAEVRRLGGPFRVPPMGHRTDRLRRFFGWKLARRLSVWRNR